MVLEVRRSACCPQQTPHCCVVSTWTRVKKAAPCFPACRGGEHIHPTQVVMSCSYRLLQLSTVAVAALSLQPMAVLWSYWHCSSHVSALQLLLCRGSTAFCSPLLAACAGIRLAGWILSVVACSPFGGLTVSAAKQV